MNGKISNLCQVSSIRRYTITEGVSKGLDVLDCDNGKIRFLLNVSRACDIMQMYHKGQNVSFVSKNGFTGEYDEFSHRFEGGMVYTCGLDMLGRREGHVTHGLFHTMNAEIVRAECDEKGIVVEAMVRQSTLFGECLVVRRKYTALANDDKVTLEDTLSNCGYTDANYCYMYHVNVGYPLLDEGSKIIADVSSVEPLGEWARENEKTALEIEKDVAGKQETCYRLTLNKPQISLVNNKLGKAFTLTYSQDTFPHFLEWKSMASGDYALGLEPGTTKFSAGFEYKVLKSGESVDFFAEFKVSEL